MKRIFLLVMLLAAFAICQAQLNKQKIITSSATTSRDTTAISTGYAISAVVTATNDGSNSSDTIWYSIKNRNGATEILPLLKGERYTWPVAKWDTINSIGNATIKRRIIIVY